MPPRSIDDLMAEALRCPCTAGGRPWCLRCACLLELVLAQDVALYEQVTGLNWWQAMAQRQEAVTPRGRARQRRLRGLGDTLLGWGLTAFAVAYYVCWVLPRTSWWSWSGQRPPPHREDADGEAQAWTDRV